MGSAHRNLGRFGARLAQSWIIASDSGPTSSVRTARISMALPVFNTMPHLSELFESLAAQDLDPSLFEVIAVDDGSTDGVGRLLDMLAARHSIWRILRQQKYGWS
ncbi:glycosyltransferase family 2 protein [Paeniglutamicibacter sp. R2-26]|uniref:glycosyltransferase family 2 protein n=1 Tax=Paeniglutamicibacter sp. R2-26 TaxID=3144417 RepID=UPI003EE467D1